MKKRAIIFLIVGLVLGTAAYVTSSKICSRCVGTGNPHDEMNWLRQEFHLTDAQFEKVKALHEAYDPKCMGMCQKIMDSSSRLETLIKANQEVTPEIREALKENSLLQNECRQAMMEHIYQVSHEMSPEQGKRYVDLMKATVLQPGHSMRHIH